MRKMRKALSFALILALILGSFSMVHGSDATPTAPAQLSDIEGLAGQEQIEVAQYLGIIEGFPDGTYQPEVLVNRAQLAAIITRALGIPDSALAGFGTTSFQDTAGYGWAIPYLAYCQSRGIMLGDGYGNAMPGRTITMNEAVTMILRAIGYVDHSDRLVGSWPANYVTLGRALGLYTDLSDEVYMDRENAAIAIYNGIIVPLVAVDTDGRTTVRNSNVRVPNIHDEVVYVPFFLASTGLDCDVDMSAMITPDYYGHSLLNVSDRLGARGVMFTAQSDSLLVAFKAESEFLTGQIDGSRFRVGDRTYTLPSDLLVTSNAGATVATMNNVALMINGVDDPSYIDVSNIWTSITGVTTRTPATDLDVISRRYLTDDRQLTLSVDLAGLTIRELYAIVGWSADSGDVVTQAQIDTIERDDRLLAGNFMLNYDQEIDTKQFTLVGVQSLDDIQVDDVVYVYRDMSGNNNDIRKVAVGQEVVEGTINEANNSRFSLDGTNYNYSFDKIKGAGRTNATEIDDVTSSYIGTDAVVRLDAYGWAYEIDNTGGEVGTFGMLYNAQNIGARGPEAKFFTSNDADEFFAFVRERDVKITSERGINVRKATVEQTYGGSTLAAYLMANSVNTLFSYTLDGRGNIATLERATTGSNISIVNNTILRRSGQADVRIDANAVVFGHGPGAQDFELSSLASIDGSKIAGTVVHYVMNNAGNRVVALSIDVDALDSGDSVYGVINNVTTARPVGSNENVVRVRALVDGGTAERTLDGFDNLVSVPGWDPLRVSLWRIV